MSDLMSKAHGRACVRQTFPDDYSYEVELTPEQEAWYAAKAEEIYGLNLPREERARRARELAKKAPHISLPHIQPRMIE
jgi:hypothetical protein